VFNYDFMSILLQLVKVTDARESCISELMAKQIYPDRL
jgi:hypothetical protein